MKGNEENALADWHVLKETCRISVVVLFIYFFFYPFCSLRHLRVRLLQNLIFNPLVWSPLTQLTQTSPASSPYPSSIHCKCLSKRRGLPRWKDELNRRWSEGSGMCWTSGCSPQLSESLLPDLEDRRRLGDPQSTGSNSRWEEKKKKKKKSLHLFASWIIELLAYSFWNIQEGGRALFQISHTVYLVLLSIFLRLFFFFFLSVSVFHLCIPPFRFGLLLQSKTINQNPRRETQRKMACYWDHKRLFLLYLEKSIHHQPDVTHLKVVRDKSTTSFVTSDACNSYSSRPALEMRQNSALFIHLLLSPSFSFPLFFFIISFLSSLSG